MQGDVFVDLPLDEGARGLGMVITHACAMRGNGGRLRPRQTVAAIFKQPIPIDRWATGFLDWMPLPAADLPEVAGDGAVRFATMTSVPVEALEPVKRLAALSEIGVQFLQQRLAAHLTRVSVELPTLAEHCRPILLEAELQEEWVTAAVGPNAEPPKIASAAASFFELLEADDRQLRTDLGSLLTEPRAVRTIRREMQQRFGTSSP